MRSEAASTTTGGQPSHFVWMMGCVLQDACDNMRVILIYKLKLEVARKSSVDSGGEASNRSTSLLRTYTGREVE